MNREAHAVSEWAQYNGPILVFIKQPPTINVILIPMTTPIMSDVTTRQIRVGARAYYLPDESDPHGNEYYFGYRILILNHSECTVQVMARHWDIIDAEGVTRTVEGDGVVGEQPILEPNKAFKYTSFCKLPTIWGTMEGRYRIRVCENQSDENENENENKNETEAENDNEFDVTIGRFWLTQEHAS